MSRRILLEDDYNNGLKPVMNGLICWLDDRDVWENEKVLDRMKNFNFLLEGTYTNPYILQNSHKFYSEKTFNLSSNFTICLTVNISHIGGYGILLGEERSKSFNPTWFKISNRYNQKIGFYSKLIGTINEGVPVKLNEKTTIVIVCREGVVSIYDYKKLAQSQSSNKLVFDYKIQIGTYGNRDDVDISSFKLNSLKIYNRALTEEEIQQNYLYEQSIERYPKIVLCENYSPNGQPFYLWQDKPIYLGESELYLNVDLSTCGTNGFEKVISLGVGDIMAWNGGKKIHIYYNKPTNVLRVQYMNNTTKYSVDKKNNNDTINNFEIVVCKNGIYLNNMLITNPNDSTLKTVNTALLSESIDIGASGTYVVYNLVCLREYQKRGE